MCRSHTSSRAHTLLTVEGRDSASCWCYCSAEGLRDRWEIIISNGARGERRVSFSAKASACVWVCACVYTWHLEYLTKTFFLWDLINHKMKGLAISDIAYPLCQNCQPFGFKSILLFKNKCLNKFWISDFLSVSVSTLACFPFQIGGGYELCLIVRFLPKITHHGWDYPSHFTWFVREDRPTYVSIRYFKQNNNQHMLSICANTSDLQLKLCFAFCESISRASLQLMFGYSGQEHACSLQLQCVPTKRGHGLKLTWLSSCDLWCSALA